MRALHWVPSRQDSRSHLLDDAGLIARCGHDIDNIGTELTEHPVPCTRCTAFLVAALLHALEVSEREAWKWLAEWRYG